MAFKCYIGIRTYSISGWTSKYCRISCAVAKTGEAKSAALGCLLPRDITPSPFLGFSLNGCTAADFYRAPLSLAKARPHQDGRGASRGDEKREFIANLFMASTQKTPDPPTFPGHTVY